MERRALLSGGMIAGVAAAVTPAGAASAGQSGSSSDAAAATQQLAATLKDILDELKAQRTSCAETTCSEVETLRTTQRTFLRAQGKFPDFIEVSIDVWEKLTDWFIRTRQPVQVARMADGRYTMPFSMTTIVLRPELQGPFISVGYDVK